MPAAGPQLARATWRAVGGVPASADLQWASRSRPCGSSLRACRGQPALGGIVGPLAHGLLGPARPPIDGIDHLLEELATEDQPRSRSGNAPSPSRYIRTETSIARTPCVTENFGPAATAGQTARTRRSRTSSGEVKATPPASAEGYRPTNVDIVLDEVDESGTPSAAAWVAANLAAVAEAIDGAHAGPLTVESLCGWHRTLMTGSPTPAQQVGVLRSEQGWIGGTSPLDAHLVRPPPDEVPALVDGLIAYVNRDDLDPVTQAAIAHAQFEIIHPFADGNGRVGRVLIAWILVRRLSLVAPPPVSARIAADVGGYGSGLVLFRAGDHRAWVRWFAEAVSGAGRAQQELVASVERLQRAWRERLARPRADSRRLRSDAAAWRVLDLLPRHLVLTGPIVASELTIPLKSANAALGELVAAGALVEHGRLQPSGRGRPSRLYTSAELLGLTGSNPLRP